MGVNFASNFTLFGAVLCSQFDLRENVTTRDEPIVKFVKCLNETSTRTFSRRLNDTLHSPVYPSPSTPVKLVITQLAQP